MSGGCKDLIRPTPIIYIFAIKKVFKNPPPLKKKATTWKILSQHKALCCSLSLLSTFLPQGICTHCSLSWKGLPPDVHISFSFASSRSFSQITSSASLHLKKQSPTHTSTPLTSFLCIFFSALSLFCKSTLHFTYLSASSLYIM